MTAGIVLMGLQGIAMFIRNVMLLAGVRVEGRPDPPES